MKKKPDEEKSIWTKKRENAKRHNRLEISLTDEELAKVLARAKSAGLKPAIYARRMALEGKMIYYDINELNNVMRSFRYIGDSFNQIAKVANSTGQVFQKDIDDMKEKIEYFDDVMKCYLVPLRPKIE